MQANEYLAWLEVAVKLLAPKGKLAFILFPEGIRETAQAERNTILSAATDMLCEISVIPNAARYSTPSFEQIEMLCRGLYPIDWRSADILLGTLPSVKVSTFAKDFRRSDESWIERRVGCGRLFVRKSAFKDGPLLSYADLHGPILSSPSRRAVGRDKANVLTSRGHGIYCNDPSRLIELVDSIKDSQDIERVSTQIEGSSKEIFHNMINDLWGRFMLCGV